MKSKFSTAWTGSSQPRKQRKYRANAPVHLKRKFLSVNLAKALREKEGKRNVVVKKGDKIKVLRGKFKGKQGKVTEVKVKLGKVIVEGMQITKKDGSKVNVVLQPSNLQIVEMVERSSKKKVSEKKETKKEDKTPKKAESKSKVEEKKK